MKNEEFLKDLHIGRIIKEIAFQKGISAKEIATAIRRYQRNAEKIFRVNDMDVEDIVTISYLLEYNLLDFIAQKFLEHQPLPDFYISATTRLMKIDIENKQFTVFDPFNNCDFLKDIYIGQHIREIAEKNKWNEIEMAKKLHCAQSMVSYIYQRKSLKIKRLIKISHDLQYHFIAAVYLSQMVVTRSLAILDGSIISLNPLQLALKTPNDSNFSVIFQEKSAKKQIG